MSSKNEMTIKISRKDYELIKKFKENHLITIKEIIRISIENLMEQRALGKISFYEVKKHANKSS